MDFISFLVLCLLITNKLGLLIISGKMTSKDMIKQLIANLISVLTQEDLLKDQEDL
jgi:hypothetical protein